MFPTFNSHKIEETKMGLIIFFFAFSKLKKKVVTVTKRIQKQCEKMLFSLHMNLILCLTQSNDVQTVN